MALVIVVLAIIAIGAALTDEINSRGRNFTGWGVVLLAAAIILIERGGS